MATSNIQLLAGGRTRRETPPSPQCVRCASSGTEPVVTMQRHTVNADSWYRCEDCGHVFTAIRPDDPLR